MVRMETRGEQTIMSIYEATIYSKDKKEMEENYLKYLKLHESLEDKIKKEEDKKS